MSYCYNVLQSPYDKIRSIYSDASLNAALIIDNNRLPTDIWRAISAQLVLLRSNAIRELITLRMIRYRIDIGNFNVLNTLGVRFPQNYDITNVTAELLYNHVVIWACQYTDRRRCKHNLCPNDFINDICNRIQHIENNTVYLGAWP